MDSVPLGHDQNSVSTLRLVDFGLCALDGIGMELGAC